MGIAHHDFIEKVQDVSYDENTEILEVVFNSGKTYQYSEVPQEVYEGLLAADSKGGFR